MANISIILSSTYDRWKCEKNTSWPLRVFNQYHSELKIINNAYIAAQKFTYTQLKKNKAIWTDTVNMHLKYYKIEDTHTLTEWSDSFHKFANWNRLNQLMALCSYFETYISSVILLSFESDPGLLVGLPHSIDGIKMMKMGKAFNRDMFEKQIEKCTKNTWPKRISAMENIYGKVPASFKENLGELEKIRVLRNKVGDAFGRDIELSRDYNHTSKLPMEAISEERLIKYIHLMYSLAHDFDAQLMTDHIGNFQPLSFYHSIRSSVDIKVGSMMYLKKSLGTLTKEQYSKNFCRWIINYYDNLK